ncbi:MAG: hypothetical protein ACHQDD_01495 [Steroidobacterales bacterium]
MAGRSATRLVPQQLLFAALLVRALACPAADGLTSVPSAHGPLMMLYIRQPLGAGAARIYGLRLDQMSSTPTLAATGPGGVAGSRDILDLQFRNVADVRVEFGRRVTWNVGRREFGPSGNPPPGMAIPLTARALSNAVAARAALP